MRTSVSIREHEDFKPAVITVGDRPIHSTGTYAEVRHTFDDAGQVESTYIAMTPAAERIQRFLLVSGQAHYVAHFFDQHHKQVMALADLLQMGWVEA